MFQKVNVERDADGNLRVDGKAVYKGAGGYFYFSQDGSHVVNYIVKVERGLALQPNEKIAFRDQVVSNLDPSNLIVFQRGENETPQNFQYRINAAIGKAVGNLKAKPLEARVPDLTTRPITKTFRQPLRAQIQSLQQIVDKRLRRGHPPRRVREDIRNLIRLSYSDVKLTDLVFGDEFKIPPSNRIVTVPPPEQQKG